MNAGMVSFFRGSFIVIEFIHKFSVDPVVCPLRERLGDFVPIIVPELIYQPGKELCHGQSEVLSA